MTAQFTAEDMVRREVGHCVSYLVHVLAQGGAATRSDCRDLSDLCEQAAELFYPLEDWEEAALYEGWTGPHKDKYGATYFKDTTDGQTFCAESWQELCEEFDIEPYQREIFEHWIVSDWLGRKLEAKGERVDFDFAGLTVWGRTTTGQAIYMDRVIEEIHNDLMSKAA